MGETALLPVPAREALRAFPHLFQDNPGYTGPEGAAWASGRVNLIGEHTDYNAGYVLPLAVDRVVAFAGRARADRMVRLHSLHFDESAAFSLLDLAEHFEQVRERVPGWMRYVLCVAAELQRAGIYVQGFDAVLQSDVPVGGGMSSSAAMEVAAVQAFQLFTPGSFSVSASNATLKPLQVAELCQHAEWAASGVRCGILDQAASCLGRAGHAFLLDCRSLEYTYLPLAAPDVSLVVIDSNVRHTLADTAYNERRQQCDDAVRLLREVLVREEPDREIQTLRDISWSEFERYQAVLPPLLRKRAGYILAENRRVLKVVELLKDGDLSGVGELLWQTHAGLRDEYAVSCMEMDTLVDLARAVPGVLGGRMMGGGFGGCTVNLVRDEAIEALTRLVESEYPARTGRQASIDICRAAGGPNSTSQLD